MAFIASKSINKVEAPKILKTEGQFGAPHFFLGLKLDCSQLFLRIALIDKVQVAEGILKGATEGETSCNVEKGCEGRVKVKVVKGEKGRDWSELVKNKDFWEAHHK